MDGNYQNYVNRVVQMTLPANYKQQLKIFNHLLNLLMENL